MRAALIAIVFAACMVYGEKPKPQRPTHAQSSADTTKEPDRASVPSVIVVNQDAAQREKDDKPSKAPGYFHELFLPQNLPTIALVGVGIGGIWVAICTLKDIQKQTRYLRKSVIASRRNAQAALLNAQAVIHAQRPWVTFFAEHSNGSYNFKAGNLGKSPARIIGYSHCIVYEHPSNLPDDPPYGTEQSPKLDFLMPGENFGGPEIEIITVTPAFTMGMDEERKRQLNDREVAIIVLLKISYEDIGNPDPSTNMHETSMCFDWTPGLDFKVSGPPEYNRHT